jgi:dihydrofolate synthase/folylpolyglutamate synthase
MGGSWDATNVLTPMVSVITPIDLDHQEYLGNTIEEIAKEKA